MALSLGRIALVTAILLPSSFGMMADAAIIPIGEATYASATNAANNTSLSGSENVYKLLYDDDRMITWLDYTNTGLTHSGATAWAANLHTALTINLYDGYVASWESTAWRLPSGSAHTGFNITTTEMGHLYYTELGNTASDATLDFGDFDNIPPAYSWSTYDPFGYPAGEFNFSNGEQGLLSESVNSGVYEMAVHPGQVVPEPTTALLLATGLAALAVRRISTRA
jgi:hypothetical protein